MNRNEFELVLDERMVKIREILTAKEEEYAKNENRFHNFDVAALVCQCTPEQALFGMFAKHLVSVMDMVSNPGEATFDLVDEKLGDAINYLMLLEGLFLRRLNNDPSKHF